MVATLYLAPTTETALQHAATEVRNLQAGQPLTPVYILLPSAAAIEGVRRCLGDTVAVHTLHFYGLAGRALERAGCVRQRIDEIAARRLIRQILTEAQAAGELSTFAAVWDKPGFGQVLLEWLREMQAQGITPGQIEAQSASASSRDRQLSRLYRRYQAFLEQRGCSDPDGLLWLAAEALERRPQLLAGDGAYLALGFDQFSPIQLRILRSLADSVPHMAIYLPWDEARPEDSLAHSRLRGTRAALLQALPLRQEALPAAPPGGEGRCGQAPVLAHVHRSIFEPAPPVADGDPPVVRVVAAPSREAEVRRALRAAKQMLLDGATPGQIALLAPQSSVYARLVQAAADEYGVPVAVEQPLALNPAGDALINLLSLPPDFPRRETFDALRSPYLRQTWLTAAQIDRLDRLTRERPVLAGRDQWRFALQPLDGAGGAADGDGDLGDLPLVTTLPAEELAAIAQGLEAFFDHLTPPATATYRGYTYWLQQAVLGMQAAVDEEDAPEAAPLHPSLDMLARCQDSAYAERDLRALAIVMQALRHLVEAVDLVPEAPGQETAWAGYRDTLLEVLTSLTIAPPPGQDRVRFGALSDARRLVMDHLFVLGLSEGEFPRAPQPDVFYAPLEREHSPLPLRRVQPGEDASLWWQILGNCRRTLTLLRPRLDENGAEWLPSAYWEATIACIEGLAGRVEQPRIAAVPGLDEAASPAELLVALALAGAAQVPASLSGAWDVARAAQAVWQQRQGWGECGQYEGILGDGELQLELANLLSPKRAWSPSRLNLYGNCPFSFFAGSLLDLEPLTDPEEGLNARQRGRLIHQVLELLYRDLAQAGIAPAPETREEILRRLAACCDSVLASAPACYGFRPDPLWHYEQEELRCMLVSLVTWECAQRDAGRFRPWLQEVRFGLPGGPARALRVVAADGTFCYVHGVIDRIDRDAAGQLRVIDYKTGSRKYSEADVLEGRALQTALYALAAEEALSRGHGVAESYYLHVSLRDRSGRLTFQGPACEDNAMQGAASRAVAFTTQARRGVFPAAPAKPLAGRQACLYTCDFAGLCRPDRRTIAKAQRWLLSQEAEGTAA